MRRLPVPATLMDAKRASLGRVQILFAHAPSFHMHTTTTLFLQQANNAVQERLLKWQRPWASDQGKLRPTQKVNKQLFPLLLAISLTLSLQASPTSNLRSKRRRCVPVIHDENEIILDASNTTSGCQAKQYGEPGSIDLVENAIELSEKRPAQKSRPLEDHSSAHQPSQFSKKALGKASKAFNCKAVVIMALFTTVTMLTLKQMNPRTLSRFLHRKLLDIEMHFPSVFLLHQNIEWD